ncbi:MAG: ectoine utilization protein EutA [Geminicoccaceae bacterium]
MTIDLRPDLARYDDRPVKHRIGFLALSTDHTSERDMQAIAPADEVGIYVSRVRYENPTTSGNLLAMQPRLAEAASLILSGEELDVIAYSCTAASVMIGDERVAASIREAKPGVPVVTPTAAAFAAFAHLGVSRVSLLTPYIEPVTKAMRDYFENHDLDVINSACLGIEDDRMMARLSKDAIVEAALATTTTEAEALFISCTAVRAADVAERIEEEIKKPVVTSNQAMAWRSLRLAGCDQSIAGFGRLLQ